MISKVKEQPIILIRIALGLAFIFHGLDKFMNLENSVGFFSSIGLPAVVLYLVAALEVLAGIGVLVNKTAKISAYVIAVIMLGAIALAKFKAGYLGGYELDIAYLAMAVTVALKSGRECHSGTCKIEETPKENSSDSSEE